MNKVVINCCYGGFSLSMQAVNWLAENAKKEIKKLANEELKKYKDVNKKETGLDGIMCNMLLVTNPIERHNPDLIRCIEALGKEASGECANLQIVKIEGNKYRIEEYDGYEYIQTPETLDWITID